jgi:hypothetical protein
MSDAALDASVTLEEVFAVLATKRVPMAPELAGYLVLEIAERVDPSAGEIDPSRIFVGDEGTVVFIKRRTGDATGDAETSVRGLLARLLLVGGVLTPGLSAAARRPSGAGLHALAGELETALIPVNRAAGRRALGRLAREVRRVKLGLGRNALPSSSDGAPPSARSDEPPTRRPLARPPSDEDVTRRRPIPNELLEHKGKSEWPEMPTSQFEPVSSPSTSQADIDLLIEQFGVSADGEKHHARALGKIVGLEPTPPPADTSNRPPEVVPRDSDVESLLALGTEASSQSAPPDPLPRAPGELLSRSAPTVALPREDRPRRASVAEPPLRHMPSAARPSLPSEPAFRRSRFSPVLAIVALIALVAAAVLILRLRPPTESASAPSAAPSAPDAGVAAQVPATCNATLVVTAVPQHAEVLLRAGQAPLDVDKMPVGARLEFVATAEGYAPKRVVVPAGAPWDTGADGKPRFEAAVQLDKSKARAGGDPWPPGEPGSEVGGQGPPGTVRVVATPRGAEVWMLAGIGPEARVDQLRCDRELDILVAGPTTFRKRLHVSASDFVDDAQATARTKVSTRIAHVSAQ